MTEIRPLATQLLAHELVDCFPAEAALELEGASDEEAVLLLSTLPPPTAAAVLDNLTPVGASSLLSQISPAVSGAMLAAIDPARAAALLARLEKDSREKILDQVMKPTAKEIAALSEYPEDSAGSLMDPQVMAFHPKMTVDAVLKRLRRLPHKRASEIFLVDTDGSLVGAVPLQDLAVANDDQLMEELLGPRPLAVRAMSSRNEVVEALDQADTAGVVVVDMENRLLGVIRRDTLIQVVQEVATADAQAMVGASKEGWIGGLSEQVIL